jgi:hypothetical protein
MTRVLKRPMFRLGGNTDQGIMSGVVPRLGYAEGKTFEERMEERQALYDKYAPTRGRGDLSQFLVDFGLNVASAEPTGSIFSTAAASAKDPYARFTAKKAERLSDQDKFTRAMIGDISEQMSEEEQERLAAGTAGRGFEYAGRYADYTTLLEEQRSMEEQMRKLEEGKKSLPPFADPSIIQSQIDRLNDQIEDNKRKQNLFVDAEKDPILQGLIGQLKQGIITAQELQDYIDTGKLPEDKATGGRVGYATAGQVIPGEMPRTSQADVMQSMSFEDLRSRLPSTITNDIIQLLANSQEALVEFSNIQTESDIRAFNRKYEVNLVLPPEA